MEKIRYFDHAATTPVKKEVLEAMIPYFHESFGNASSLYSIGRNNKRVLELSREKVARCLGANKNEIYFTSCGSESDNLAIKGVAYANKEKGNHIITSKIEHPAVLNTCKTLEKQGFNVTYLNIDEKGFINLNELKNAITDKTILISIMFANNEIGTIQPIKEIAKIAKGKNIYFHTDGVQAVGNVKIDVEELGIDMLSLSAHKFYGPKGMGALYVRKGVEFDRIQDGGHQEKNKRAGTENIAGIVGLSKALEIATKNLDKYNEKLLDLRKYFIEKVQERIADIKINGSLENRLPGNINMSFKGINGEKLLFKLDEKGICASAGSACSSGTSQPSHVLLALGLTPEYANSTLRITFGEENTKEDVDYLVDCLDDILNIKNGDL